jgi:16S rRNA C967 or C1407 C5-methylase (RsmB/RsmF family)
MAQTTAENLISTELQSFYKSHGIDNIESLLEENVGRTRFIRLNPRFDKDKTLASIPDAKSIPWLEEEFGFYSIPSSIRLNEMEYFHSGKVYGMDVSSGAAVAVLLTNQYDKNDEKLHENQQQDQQRHGTSFANERILDLCCAPGLKLCMIADRIPVNEASGVTLVGVDVSEKRMSLCKKIVRKYHIHPKTSGRELMKTKSPHIQLYCEDGTSFGTKPGNLIFDSVMTTEEEPTITSRKRLNKSARAREQKRLKCITSSSSELPVVMGLFDRVLVDAECSTDGSLKHMVESLRKKNQNDSLSNQRLTDETHLMELLQLQRGLAGSGYRLLRPGGVMVYSTCSISHSQNEDVVKWLLEIEKDAFLIPLKFPKHTFISEGELEGTVRFKPSCTEEFSGGGFFVAKIGKKVDFVSS